MTALVDVARRRTARDLSAGLFRRVVRKPLGVAAAFVLIAVIAGSFLAPLLAPYDPLEPDLSVVKQLPSAAHLLGTDSLGRDVLSRLLYGGQESLIGVAQAVVVMLLIAIPLGVLAGYLGGATDWIVLRVVDILLSIPALIITLAVLSIFNSSMFAAMVTVGALASGAFIRIFRSAALGVRRELYIGAARVAGISAGRIMAQHVFPQIRGVLLVQVSLFSAATLGIQTGLAFLAFGPPPPAPTWGGMVAEAATLIQQDPWLLVPSGGIIAITTLALVLLGDAVRDANQERYALRSTSARAETAPAPAPEPEPSRAGAVLAVRDLTIGFGDRGRELVVVQGADFDVLPGEVVGLVGESGSGKTVTALAILGLLGGRGRILSGSVTLDGVELVGLGRRRMRALRGSGVAMIAQEPLVALDPSFTIGSQLGEAVRVHRRGSRRATRERVAELLTRVQLDPDVARKYPHEISGGMAQRVAIALALAGDPRVLIADEPTTALDVTVQAEILDLLRGLQREKGMAVVLVSHDWGVVADLCTRAVVMYAGQVVERADVAQIFRAPRHPYTRALLRSNPHGATRGEPLPTIGGSVPAPRDWPRGCRFAARCGFAVDECRVAPIPMVPLGDDRASRCIRIDELEAAR